MNSDRFTAYLAGLDADRLGRLWRQCWNRMSEGDGCQPFGYDWPTLRVLHPEWYRILNAIHVECASRLDMEVAR